MVLIKDMEKPHGCGECRLKDNYYKECNITHKKIHSWIGSACELPEWCPLVEVEPYGPEGTLYREKRRCKYFYSNRTEKRLRKR